MRYLVDGNTHQVLCNLLSKGMWPCFIAPDILTGLAPMRRVCLLLEWVTSVSLH